MKENHTGKILAIGIIVLFIGTGVIPSIGISIIQTYIPQGTFIYTGDYDSRGYIQGLIDNASDGDTIIIPSGIYYENIIIDKSISLIGEDKETTIIDGSGIGTVVKVSADWVNISGFTIQNGGDIWSDAGINAMTNYSNFYGNIIKNNGCHGIYLRISIEKCSHDNNISNNYIYNNKYGVYPDGRKTKNVKLYNNTISENTIISNYYGIHLMHCRGEKVINNIIIDNYRSIEISLGTSNIIKNNEISSSVKGIWVFDTNNNVIDGNNIRNHSEWAIYVIGSYSNNILYNNFSNNNQCIIMDNAENCIISGNNITNSHGKGITIGTNCKKNDILNNKFTNNSVGLHVTYLLVVDNIISENMFFNDGLFIESTQSNTYSNNIINYKPLILLIGESDKTIDGVNAGQIILIKCNNITVKNEYISNTVIGIELYSSSNCLISDNIFSNNNRNGIYIRGHSNTVCRNHIKNSNDAIYIFGDDNVISYNDINKNSRGIFWQGESNTVERNNFILNLHDAKFHVNYKGSFKTIWNSNYWDRPRILPKVIMGKKDIFLYEDVWGDVHVLTIPWIGFDWYPALKPYDIGI